MEMYDGAKIIFYDEDAQFGEQPDECEVTLWDVIVTDDALTGTYYDGDAPFEKSERIRILAGNLLVVYGFDAFTKEA